MAITNCKECSGEVSTKAGKCPHCGAPTRKPAGCLACLGCLSIMFLGFVFFAVLGSLSEQNRPIKKRDGRPISGQMLRTPEAIREAISSHEIIPSYKILNEEISDTPGKAQVILNVLVSPDEVSVPSLKSLLNKLYASASAKKGFQYHESPTLIGIYIYTSTERAESGMGQWIAMLLRSPGKLTPDITINERQTSQIGKKPETKFGLSETRRKEVWAALIRNEDRATEEAGKRYPDLDPSKPGYSRSVFLEQLGKQQQMRETVNEKYDDQSAQKFGLTRKQLHEIELEGLTKDWAFPR